MTNKQGEFIWYELMTSDIEAARSFYQAVVGWKIGVQSDMPGMDYRMVDAPDGSVAGMMQIDAEMASNGATPVWLGYIGVDDVDASAKAIKAAGGHIHIPPTDIPDVGRFAMAADPQGAPFYVMRGSVEATSTAFAPEKLGHCAWNELWTSDQAGAHAFYAKLFGWKQDGVMPMGEMGDYCFLYLDDTRLGATGRTKDQPRWLPYFTVPSIKAAAAAVSANGGTVTNGPHEVPGGGHIIMGKDPQGAQFALVADQ